MQIAHVNSIMEIELNLVLSFLESSKKTNFQTMTKILLFLEFRIINLECDITQKLGNKKNLINFFETNYTICFFQVDTMPE